MIKLQTKNETMCESVFENLTCPPLVKHSHLQLSSKSEIHQCWSNPDHDKTKTGQCINLSWDFVRPSPGQELTSSVVVEVGGNSSVLIESWY